MKTSFQNTFVPHFILNSVVTYYSYCLHVLHILVFSSLRWMKVILELFFSFQIIICHTVCLKAPA